MPRVKHHRSSRRVPPPKDSDFDHEIKLVDHSTPEPCQDDDSLRTSFSHGTEPPVAEAGPSSDRREPPDTAAAEAQGDEHDHVGTPPAEAVENGHVLSAETAGGPSLQLEQPTPEPGIDRPKRMSQVTKPRSRPKTPESAIDILYENQRGGFLCGMPLFSCKALGNLDPTPWTNHAHHPSPTDTTNAQVPDPSWEWAWPEWRINHDDGVDGDGWEYSFMFSKKFSWHKASWWNSFVRRRAWIRKRIKKDNAGYLAQHDPQMLNPEYFLIRPSAELERERTPSGAASKRGSRVSVMSSSANGEPQCQPPATIEHVSELLAVLRGSRIDREKIEALDNYLENAEDELEGLQDTMHEVMSLFVFQASRRALLTRLTEVLDKTVALREERKRRKDTGPGADEFDRKVDNLAATIKHADEEVRRLEYWSDIKGMAAEGESKGAVDHTQGWDPGWQGLDQSGAAEPVPKYADDGQEGK
ncbi:hypothetical protein B0T25DRAFT_123905 [Lasiosphaeria hispida]|uniref:Meiotically up-regulated 65 protein n=1 Tax=Lasiosphaeria hispida TaxID=260671 RepID=A0AAJ0MID0_9PEZI|nr:hypothetical protein B0T25DRAFT_123905 [Lasiosphaeria hispida]